MTTAITTPYQRKLIVTDGWDGPNAKHIEVRDSLTGEHLSSTLLPEDATKDLIQALAGENAAVFMNLPEVRVSLSGNRVYAGDCDRSLNAAPEDILKTAKNLLSIHAAIVKHNDEQEAAKIAEAEAAQAKEASRAKRRDEVATEVRGYGSYFNSSSIFQKAIDRIIDLEEAAKVS